jgi:hypothetical protein
MINVEANLKYLDISVIRKIADTNNVRVTFNRFGSDGTPNPVIIGRKQLVLILEALAADPIVRQFKETHERAVDIAKRARAQLWPQSLLN